MPELTVDELAQGLSHYTLVELVGCGVGIAVASQEARAEYGEDVSSLPAPLRKFIERMIEVSEKFESDNT